MSPEYNMGSVQLKTATVKPLINYSYEHVKNWESAYYNETFTGLHLKQTQKHFNYTQLADIEGDS